jgi:xylulose-5-phosphate/fructose-6-phosphate phosphoketolase
VCLGDGGAETGPLATAWHSTKFLDPVGDGAVLPILHLNGYKIANPALLARIGDAELTSLLEGFGHTPYLVAGNHPQVVHQQLAATLDHVLDEIARVQTAARTAGSRERPSWPMIVLRTPKGWTGPEVVDGVPVEDTWRSHQVPVAGVHDRPEHLAMLEDWLRSYQPDELFDADGRPRTEIVDWIPTGDRRLGANPHTNGGRDPRDLDLPDFRTYAVPVPSPGATSSKPTRVLGGWLRDVMSANAQNRNFRIVGPDETESGCRRCTRSPVRRGRRRPFPVDEHLDRGEGCSRSSPSTPARVGSRGTCSLAGTACSPVTRRSCTSSTRCSASTPGG